MLQIVTNMSSEKLKKKKKKSYINFSHISKQKNFFFFFKIRYIMCSIISLGMQALLNLVLMRRDSVVPFYFVSNLSQIYLL